MKKLFILELKKIIKKRMNILIIAICTLLITFLFILPVSQYIILDQNGNQIAGKAAIAQEKKYENTYAGILTEEKVSADIAAYQSLFENPANLSKDSDTKALNKDAYYQFFFPYIDYWEFVNSNYIAPNTYDSSFSTITNIDINEGANFYAARNKKINALLNQVYTDWNFSDTEKNFWLKRISSIDIPYRYSYHAGWEMLLSCMELFTIGIIGICICVSGVFANEYQSGSDSIILSSLHGKSKLLIAKILATYTFSMLTFTLFIVIGCGIQLITFGFDGWNLPIQVLSSISPYPVTLCDAVLLSILTLYLILFGMVSFTLFLSARMKSSIPAIVTIIFVMMFPAFVGISLTNGIWNRILMISPYRASQPVFDNEFYGYFGYPIGIITLDIITVRIVIYILISLIFLPFTRRAWTKHQVQ